MTTLERTVCHAGDDICRRRGSWSSRLDVWAVAMEKCGPKSRIERWRSFDYVQQVARRFILQIDAEMPRYSLREPESYTDTSTYVVRVL